MPFVLDCSVAVKWFVPEPLSPVAWRVLDALRAGETPLFAPEIILAEFGHTLRKLVVRRELAPDESKALLDDFLALDLVTVPVRPLAADALRLCTAHMSTYYDALYMALALREGVDLLTADERSARAFAPLGRVKLLGDLER